AGSYAVTASTAGVVTPASFNLTNTAGVAATITATAGSTQSTAVNTSFPKPDRKSVVEGNSNPVSGVTVTIAEPGSGASATFTGGATATTNAAGVATTTVTANAVAGSYAVTASTAGVSTPASFNLTNTAGVAATITATAGSSQSTAVNTSFPN